MDKKNLETQLMPPSFSFRRVSSGSQHEEKVQIVLKKGICNMSKLSLKQLPMQTISQFSKVITYLNISHNAIEEIPENMFDVLTGLTILDISFNQISWIPDNFGNLVNLKEIYAASNNIRYLPLKIAEMRHIEIMDFWENPLWDSWKRYIKKVQRRYAGPTGDVQKKLDNLVERNDFRYNGEVSKLLLNDGSYLFDTNNEDNSEPLVEIIGTIPDENVGLFRKYIRKPVFGIGRKMKQIANQLTKTLKLEPIMYLAGGTLAFGFLTWLAYHEITTHYPGSPVPLVKALTQEFLKEIQPYHKYLAKLNPWNQEVPSTGYITGILLGILNMIMSDRFRHGALMLLRW